MKVDICSICFNEEALIRMWIESWLSVPWIGKIFLIDGGSTDNSVEIAKSYEDEVEIIVVPWKNDFARQRNIAIKLAKSDWLIQPDLDEIPCGSIKDDRLEKSLNRNDINQIVLPYIKFYNWNTLWFFKDRNTPNIKEDLVSYGTKSTLNIFKRGHLLGYGKFLHEMPFFNGNEKTLRLGYSSRLSGLGKNGFLIGHYDQSKHFEQAKRNNTSIELEMGLKRVRYRLISDAVYDGKTYNRQWAEEALKQYSLGNVSMIEELGAAQLKEFHRQHQILNGFDASVLNNQFVKKYAMV